MIHILERLYAASQKLWHGWLQLSCPRKYIEEIHTKNEEDDSHYETQRECAGGSELECRTDSTNETAQYKERDEATNVDYTGRL